MRFRLLTLFIYFTINLTAQPTDFNPSKTYHPDSLRRWTKSVLDEISKKHPGFYQFTAKDRFNFLIDSTLYTVNDSLTELQYYRILKPLIAKIGCMHTGVSLSKEYDNYLGNTSTFIPIEVFIDSQNKVYLANSYDTVLGDQIGSEVISINGKPTYDILTRLLQAIPSDGYNQTEKILILNHRFPFWYQTMIEAKDTFKVELKTSDTTQSFELKGVSRNVFPTLMSLEHNYIKPLNFTIADGIGILKVHSFAKSTMKSYGQNFKKFTKETFRTINKSDIRNLIIDLRYNTGGTDGNAVFLASHFFNKPFRYWEKIEVTEAIAKEIKGIYRIFYRKPIKLDGIYHWKKTWLTSEFNYYEIQKPARNNFDGKAIILTNGLCVSSCSDFVAVLSHNKKAKVVGQETGGGYQGNNSGMIPSSKIPTGLQITVPLQKYTNAVDLQRNFGHGTIPDYEITPTLDAWVGKKDLEMELAKKLIMEN
jgi:hypothetical protein